MAEQKLLIPLKDLVELYKQNRLPINKIHLKFKDYTWLAKFFEDCFNYLCTHKKIVYHEKLCWAHGAEIRWFRGHSALQLFVKKELHHDVLNIHYILGKREGVSLLAINFLVEKCNKNLSDVEKQVEKIYRPSPYPESCELLGAKAPSVLKFMQRILSDAAV